MTRGEPQHLSVRQVAWVGIAWSVILALTPTRPADAQGTAEPSGIESAIPLPANPARLAILGRGLGFPFRRAQNLTEIRAYGISPWGFEPVHNGIDLIANPLDVGLGTRLPVLSPVDGVVIAVRETVNEDEGERSTLVVIEANPSLWVALGFEPMLPAGLSQMQTDAIEVSGGQWVRQGQRIGFLIVGEGSGTVGSGLPHVDYRLILKERTTTLEDLLSGAGSHNDVSRLPTFLCPYDYSSTSAKRDFESILSRADPVRQCQCPCRFPYNAAACGSGCVD